MIRKAALHVNVVVPVLSSGSGGLGRHLREVVPRWATDPRVEAVVLHTGTGLLSELDELGVEVKRYPVRRIGPVGRRFVAVGCHGEKDVTLNVTSRPVRSGGTPVVTMVQNVEPIQSSRYRMSVLWRLRLWALKWETLQACREASRVIAVSRYVKERLCSARVSASKIDVIYHGGSPPTMEARCPSACSGLRGPFVFSAGSMVPYRGFEDLIRAAAVLRAQGRRPPAVVLGGSGGGLGTPYERWLRALPGALGVDSDISWAGQLSQREMTWCFQHAAAVIQTSRAESFCLFQVEAMYAGAVMISCTQPPMPEILGEAAIYYKPGSASDLADLMCRRLEMGEVEVAARRQAALARASQFTWDQTACQTLDSLDAAWKVCAHSRR